MKLFLKIFGFTLLFLVGLVAVVLVAVQFISDDQYRKWITGAAESATGRELTIDGELDVTLGTTVGLLARDVRFGNAEWGSRDEMVNVERLLVQVPLFPLFKGVLDVTVEVDGPDILLETDAEGTGNWVFGEPSSGVEEKADGSVEEGEDTASGLPIRPYIRNFEINNLVFAFKDEAGGQNIDAGVEELRIFVDGEQIPLTLKATYQGAPITLDGSLGNIEQWFENQQTPLALNGKLHEALLSVTGTVGPVLPQPRAKIDIGLSADSISTFSDFAGTALPDLEGLQLALTTVAVDGRLSTENITISLQDPRLNVEVIGAVQDLTDTGTIDLQVAISSESANELLAGLNQQIPYTLPSEVDVNASIYGDFSAISVSDLELSIKDEGLDVNLAGALENLLAPEGGEVVLQVLLDSTGTIGQYINQEIPSFGPLSGTARISSEGTRVQLESLELDVSDPLITAKINGSASEIGRDAEGDFAVNGIALTGDITSENLQGIADTFAVALPGELPASFSLHGEAGGNLSELALQVLNASVLDEGIEVQVSGNVENLIGLKGVEASVFGTVEDTSLFTKFAGTEIPSLGSLDLQGQLVSTPESYRLNSLDVKLAGGPAEVSLKAAVEDLLKLTMIEAELDVNLESLSELSELAQTELPQTGPWKVHLAANSDNLRESPLVLAADFGGEGMNAVLNANVPDISAPQTFQTELKVDMVSIAQVLAIAGREVPEQVDTPMNIAVKAKGKPGEYNLENFSVTNEESEISGDLLYLVPPAEGVERPSLSGKLTINNFDINPFLEAKREAEEEVVAESPEAETPETEGTDAPADADGEPKKLFSSEPLAVGILHNYDIDLKIDASNVIVRDGVVLNGDIDVILDDGYLSVDPLQLDESKGGTGKGYVHLDTRAEDAILEVVLHFDEFSGPRFGGLIDLDVELDGKGATMASLMGSLDGYFAASLRGVELERSFMSQFGAGLLRHLNPVDSQKTMLECAVARFDIEDGLADFHKKIAAQTPEVTWIGGGEINLKTEELDVGISPKPRGAVSSLTNVNIASLVHVGGTLAEPKVGVDMVDMAKKYAEYSAFIATGGLSFLAQKLVETTQANVDQCERILKDLGEED